MKKLINKLFRVVTFIFFKISTEFVDLPHATFCFIYSLLSKRFPPDVERLCVINRYVTKQLVLS